MSLKCWEFELIQLPFNVCFYVLKAKEIHGTQCLR